MTFLDFIGLFAANEKRRNRAQDWHVRCPAHDDSTPSLHVSNGGDKILLTCFGAGAGCTAAEICAAKGITLEDLRYATPWPRPAPATNGAGASHTLVAPPLLPPSRSTQPASPSQSEIPPTGAKIETPRRIVATYDYVDAA